MPRVSVIIPAFNAEAHIAEALQSVFAQTYEDWEIVLADDASSDRTIAIAAGFGNRVRMVRSSTNVGPAAARNLAIAHSEAELLAFLDADDYWLPEYLTEQVDLFDSSRPRETRVGLVACNALIMNPDALLPATYMDYTDSWGEVTLIRLLRSNPIFASAISPRTVVDEAGGYAPGILAEDHDLWLRIVERGYRVVVNPRPLAVYRVTPGSASSDHGAMARAARVVNERALERGSLAQQERRVAQRELRRYRAVERIASGRGPYWRRILRTLPLLVLVALEHPRRWRSFARALARGSRAFDRFSG
jgi:glycosyltransferase involved in cell wall biosynthesis